MRAIKKIMSRKDTEKIAIFIMKMYCGFWLDNTFRAAERQIKLSTISGGTMNGFDVEVVRAREQRISS